MTEPRRNCPHFRPIQTRWNDNDLYGHVNKETWFNWSREFRVDLP
jgi:acyl-CoA thioester hydrolase